MAENNKKLFDVEFRIYSQAVVSDITSYLKPHFKLQKEEVDPDRLTNLIIIKTKISCG